MARKQERAELHHTIWQTANFRNIENFAAGSKVLPEEMVGEAE